MVSFAEIGRLEPIHELCSGNLNNNESKSNMSVGTVKWFNSVKGYGFISPDDGSKDALFPLSSVRACQDSPKDSVWNMNCNRVRTGKVRRKI